MYGPRKGMGACGVDPQSGEQWCSPDTGILQFDLAADARRPRSDASFAAWLNRNAMSVAIGAGLFFVVLALTKR